MSTNHPTPRTGPTPAQRRNKRKQEEAAYAKNGKSARLKASAFSLRMRRLTKKERQDATFIMTGKRAGRHPDSKEAEQQRRMVAGPLAIIMEGPMRSRKSIQENIKRLKNFLANVFTKRTARAQA